MGTVIVDQPQIIIVDDNTIEVVTAGVQGPAGAIGPTGPTGPTGPPPTIATPNTSIQFNNSGVLGGSSNLEWNGSKLITSGFQLTTSPTSGYVLTSDSSGNGTWVTLPPSGVVTVSNSDGTLTISPTTGNVVASLNLGNANTWTANQTFHVGTNKNLLIQSGVASPSGVTLNVVNDAVNANVDAELRAGAIYFTSESSSFLFSAASFPVFRLTGTRAAINAGTTPAATLEIDVYNATDIGVIVLGQSLQTADLTQWQDHSGNLQAVVTKSGKIASLGGSGASISNLTGTYGGLYVQTDSNAAIFARSGGEFGFATTSLGTYADGVFSGNSITFQTYNSGFLQSKFFNTGHWAFGGTTDSGQVTITASSSSTKGVIVQGASSQTADLQQWQSSTPTVLSSVNASGGFVLNPSAGISMDIQSTASWSGGLRNNLRLTATDSPALRFYSSGTNSSGTISYDGNALYIQPGATGDTAAGTTVQFVGSVTRIFVPVLGYTPGNVYFGMNSTGTNYSMLQNDAADTWSIATGNALSSLQTPLLQWTKSGNFSIFSQSVSAIPLTIKAAALQSADLLDFTNSSGVKQSWFDSAGVFNVPNTHTAIKASGGGQVVYFDGVSSGSFAFVNTSGFSVSSLSSDNRGGWTMATTFTESAYRILTLAPTWNANVTMTAFLINVTNTSSGAASLLADFQIGGASKLAINKAGQLQTSSGNESTGSGSAALGSNCPASTASAPYTWIAFKTSDGSTVYIPAWK